MTSLSDDIAPTSPHMPPPPPPLPPPPPQTRRPVPLEFDNVSSRQLTSPVQSITKETSSQTLGRDAYQIFCDKRSDISECVQYCFISYYQHMQPILQNGPVCGIVALAMAAPLLGKANVMIEDIFKRSRELNFSKQGELYSVEYMSQLARDTLQCSAEVLCVCEDEDRGQIVENLIQGSLLLIPYDSDKNHRPCLKKGHKAHWAVLTGFFLVLDKTVESSICSQCTADTEQSGLYHCSDLSVLGDLQRQTVVDVIVYGQQGKSKYPGVWTLDDVLASNGNLRELDPERAAEEDSYVIPPGGVSKGLCGRIIVLTKDAND